jgi:hypothetical protein
MPAPDLESAFETLDDVVLGLTRLEERLYESKDRRVVFATAYLTMTLEIAKRVGEQTYNDPEWVARYAIAFANLYRTALVAFQAGDSANVPVPWRISFETASKRSNLLFQDLLLGINAHINHDLALALAEVSIDPNREARRADHFAVNEAIGRATNAVQDRLGGLYAPLFGHLDRLLGGFDERAAGFSIEKARLNAWTSAISLVNTKSDVERAVVIQTISDRAAVIARLILLPTRRSFVLRVRQILERLTARWELIRPGF